MEVYEGEVIRSIKDFYGSILYNYQSGITIRQRLSDIAVLLWQAYRDDNPVVLNQINNYNKDFLSKSWKEIKSAGFDKKDAFNTIANEYGYESWLNVPRAYINCEFEKAVDALLSGDIEYLRHAISKDATLLHRRSQYPHRATLFHYLGSNGVELYRQIVPLNIVDVMSFMLDSGADRLATMPIYNGDYTMIELLKTSAHPKDAGILESIEKAYNLYKK